MEETKELEPVSAFVWAGLVISALSALFIFLSFADAKGIFGPMGSVGMLVASGALGLSVLGRFRSQKRGIGTAAILVSAFLSIGIAILILGIGLIAAAIR